MRSEIFKLWHLVQKRNSLEDAATALSSPGFEQSYGSTRCTEAPYEKYIIAACDMQEEIDEAVLAAVKSYEDDNNDILAKATGQRQRALRLCFLCGKDDEFIAKSLGIGVRTVEKRMKGVAEKVPDSEFAVFCMEMKLMPLDVLVEEHLVKTYRNIQRMVGETYDEVEKLIEYHEQRGNEICEQHRLRTERIQGFIDGLDDEERIVVEMWRQGDSWEEIGEAVGCSPRYARKKFVKITRFAGF